MAMKRVNRGEPKPDKNFGKDIKTFEKQPAKNKEMAVLQHRAEKATGTEAVALSKTIRARAKSLPAKPAPVKRRGR